MLRTPILIILLMCASANASLDFRQIGDDCDDLILAKIDAQKYSYDKLEAKSRALKKVTELEIEHYVKQKYGTLSRANPEVSRILENAATTEVQSYILEHGHKTKHSILLVHDVGGSPYYTRQYGEFLYELGYNVVGIVLPGHGYDRAALENAQLSSMTSWLLRLSVGVHIAKILGDKIIGVGFGSGASLLLSAAKPTLAIQVASKRARPYILSTPGEFSGLVLLNPIINFSNQTVNDRLSNYYNFLRFIKPSIAMNLSSSMPYRYSSIATQALWTAKQFMNAANKPEEWEFANKEHIPPILTVYSEADEFADANETVKFLNDAGLDESTRMMLIPKQERLGHIGIMRARSDDKDETLMSQKQFGRIQFRVQEFLSINELLAH